MIKINLLPAKVQKSSLIPDVYLFFSIALIVALFITGAYFFNAKGISDYSKKIVMAKKEIAGLQPVYKEYLAMEHEKKEIQRRVKTIESIREGRALSARLLYDLSSLIKDNVWLKTFRKLDAKIELDGRSLENESISSLIENLSNIPYLRNIELRNVEDTVEDGMAVKKFGISGELAL